MDSDLSLDAHLQRLRQQTDAIAVWLVQWDWLAGQRRQYQAVNLQAPAYHPQHFALLASEVQAVCTQQQSQLQRVPPPAVSTISDTNDTTAALQTFQLAGLLPGQRFYIYPFASPFCSEAYIALWCSQPLGALAQWAAETALALLAHNCQVTQTMQQQTVRLSTLQAMLKRSGHQLRNPLALIRLSAQNLALGLGDELEQALLHEQIQVIQDTAQELSENFANLLSLHDHGEWQPEMLELRELVQAVVASQAERTQAQALHVELPTNPLMVWGDRWRLKQVLQVLLNNALAFAPPQSTLTWQWQTQARRVTLGLRDRGPGIPADQLKSIFEPFYSQRPGGTGLGLAIAQDLVRQHYGHIWAENHSEGGAQFWLTLPCPEPGGMMGKLGEFRL